MAIKGLADEVVSALNYDPFEAMNESGQTGQSGQTRTGTVSC